MSHALGSRTLDATDSREPRVHRFLGWLRYVNNLLLIPMFTVMILETSTGTTLAKMNFGIPNLFFCASFMLEWSLGWAIATNRRAYLRDVGNVLDFFSALPFGVVFQGLRAVRLLRILRVVRLALRARRFQGKGARLIRVTGLVGTTVFAGALAIRIVEPSATTGFFEAIWWSVVTLSTVGYGDITPTTLEGRLVATALITIGVGVFGYVAGFMTSLLDDPEDDEILLAVQRLEAKLDHALRVQQDASHSPAYRPSPQALSANVATRATPYLK